ncbi:VOC family protein [Roseisalinus antarcticus]|uniref:Glyoxalase-like domain protein n=1 Tax=Roseisalinus antarcticus TaxID=254357 RepID=A0A1Y5SH91_9RHOB|nr:VOC family protein [Roseisalinus antarcticus]SLN40457.1 Glyoxalase-like domain protein [Roseisalinus antarcticus]
MEKVTGIGGVFFRAAAPATLAAWYRDHLGVDPVSETGAWTQTAGPTVFAPFSQDTTYFGDPAQAFMINFRVADLAAMIAQLEAAGITVETRADWDSPEIGRFARIHDPEGNPIELWEPAAGAGA